MVTSIVFYKKIFTGTSCNECEIYLIFLIQVQLGPLTLDLFTWFITGRVRHEMHQTQRVTYKHRVNPSKQGLFLVLFLWFLFWFWFVVCGFVCVLFGCFVLFSGGCWLGVCLSKTQCCFIWVLETWMYWWSRNADRDWPLAFSEGRISAHGCIWPFKVILACVGNKDNSPLVFLPELDSSLPYSSHKVPTNTVTFLNHLFSHFFSCPVTLHSTAA